MKIDEYYRNVARISLNGSIAALFPAILIAGGNLVYFRHSQIMLLTIPFLIFSIVNFQLYIRRTRQSLMIRKSLINARDDYQSLFASEHLLLFFYNTLSPSLEVFFPDGCLAGKIKKCQERVGNLKTYALYDSKEELLGTFMIYRKETLKINVYNSCHTYIGCLEIKKQGLMKKTKKELLNADGRFMAAVEGSSFYMDEQVVNPSNHQIGRLRRGWMPLEWSNYFPEPNTPVFELAKDLPDNLKLLHLSFLINEFFIKR